MKEPSAIRFGMSPSSNYCPHCGSTLVRRSRRKSFFEKSLGKALLLNPYRCKRCDGRYFVLGRRTAVQHRGATPSNSPQTL
jgi:transposase-like protein